MGVKVKENTPFINKILETTPVKSVLQVQLFSITFRAKSAFAYNSTMITCEVESNVPIPTSVGAPYTPIRRRAAAACKAAKMLLEEGHTSSTISEDTKKKAAEVVKALAVGKENTLEAQNALNDAISTPEGAVQTHAILSQFDMEVVQDARRLRNYVTNKLILESENMDPRIRIKALELLGKITDVGLFTERTEVTYNNASTTELEAKLKSKLQKLLSKDNVEDAIVLSPSKPVSKPPVPVEEVLKDL